MKYISIITLCLFFVSCGEGEVSPYKYKGAVVIEKNYDNVHSWFKINYHDTIKFIFISKYYYEKYNLSDTIK